MSDMHSAKLDDLKLRTASDVRTTNLSFEFFPPKTPAMETQLWSAIQRLAPLRPSFVSVTYGAGGTTQARTHATVARILQDTTLCPAAHLTCVGATGDEVDEVARAYWDLGVRHLVALRGDPPPNSAYVPNPNGYPNAADLVAGLLRVAPFEISVAAYPEQHPESRNAQEDIDNLRRKLDAGATRAITQFCFDTSAYLRFRDRCAAAGIFAPIIPGLLPITNFTQMTNFAARCGAGVPAWLHELFADIEPNTESATALAAIVAAEQARLLQSHGVDDIHVYTMNRADLCVALGRLLTTGRRSSSNG
jgi:methylenetetrahydrofolate reductase (NADPH)